MNTETMRKKIVELTTKEVSLPFTVKELSIEDILLLIEKYKANSGKDKISFFKDFTKEILIICFDMTEENILKLTPSQLICGIEIFKEKNLNFLLIPESLGIGELMEEAMKEFSGSCAAVKITGIDLIKTVFQALNETLNGKKEKIQEVSS